MEDVPDWYPGPRPRQEDRPSAESLNDRFYNVVAALATLEDDERSGKIPYRTLALHLSDAKDSEVTLKRYLKRKFRANAEHALALGEALHAAGVPWCSGWWMLYAAGRFDAYVYVTAQMFEKSRQRERGLQHYHLVWDLIVSAHELCLSSDLDDEPVVAALHRDHSGSIVKANQIYCSARPVEESSQQSSLNFLRRETAKAHYKGIDAVRCDLTWAYEKLREQLTKKHTDRYKDFRDRHINFAIAQAMSSNLTLSEKEFSVRHHLREWLEATAPSTYKLELPEYELSSIEEQWHPMFGYHPAVTTDDERMLEALGRISSPWFYGEEVEEE